MGLTGAGGYLEGQGRKIKNAQDCHDDIRLHAVVLPDLGGLAVIEVRQEPAATAEGDVVKVELTVNRPTDVAIGLDCAAAQTCEVK